MKILAAGGGSGGHVTPVVAVLRELKKQDSKAEIRFWCDRRFASQARSIIAGFDPDIPVSTIFAGKLRRYHNLPLWRQSLRPVSIVLPNLRDLLLVAVGTMQSVLKLLFWRPDVVFTKGGFVCLPIGVAAKLLHIPLVIHDSDAHPGLTNRILARWATAIATGADLSYYPSYPKYKTRSIGTPVREDFRPFTNGEQTAAKQALGFDAVRKLVVITGGGLGAQRINDAVAICLKELLKHSSVLLISGTRDYDELKAITPHDDPRFRLEPFISEGMAEVLGAADVVVARAGATTILELAALAKPTILVPNAFLTGGHQLKNAEAYVVQGAVEILNDDELFKQPNLLAEKITKLIADESHLKNLSKNIHTFAKPHAARDMADMIISAVKHR
jgi:UDP-N-acetylglucosamine--N-acetylmuramyl-(pentapeptide) pyrophosphoryl-undecaprenol N-acetylglucosamine transferase